MNAACKELTAEAHAQRRQGTKASGHNVSYVYDHDLHAVAQWSNISGNVSTSTNER